MIGIVLLSFILVLIQGLKLTPHQPVGVVAYNKLTPTQQQKMAKLKSKFGMSLERALVCARTYPEIQNGVFVPDSSFYRVFEDYFHTITNMLNPCDTYAGESHSSRFQAGSEGQLNFSADDLELLKDVASSSRLRVGRNLADFPYTPAMTKQQRIQVESLILKAIQKLPDQYQGEYIRISELNETQLERLFKEHILFKRESKFKEVAGIYTDWPYGRGVYLSHDRKFMVWIGEQDHLRVIYLDKGVDFAKRYHIVGRALSIMEQQLNFAYDDTIGYLAGIPDGLGTTLRASVQLKLYHLNADQIDGFASENGLVVRGTYGGGKSKVFGHQYQLSNDYKTCLTVKKLIQKVVKGTAAIIRADSIKAETKHDS